MTALQTLNNLIEANLASGTSITAIELRDVLKLMASSTIPANRGFIMGVNSSTGLDVYSTGTRYCSGDITSAVASNRSILCTMQNIMPSMNYLVKIYIQSLGSDGSDSRITCPSFKIVSTSQFNIVIDEVTSVTQQLKIHLEVISLD